MLSLELRGSALLTASGLGGSVVLVTDVVEEEARVGGVV